MTAKREAEQRLDDIVSLAQSVIDRARAAQVAIANIDLAPPDQRDDSA